MKGIVGIGGAKAQSAPEAKAKAPGPAWFREPFPLAEEPSNLVFASWIQRATHESTVVSLLLLD